MSWTRHVTSCAQYHKEKWHSGYRKNTVDMGCVSWASCAKDKGVPHLFRKQLHKAMLKRWWSHPPSGCIAAGRVGDSWHDTSFVSRPHTSAVICSRSGTSLGSRPQGLPAHASCGHSRGARPAQPLSRRKKHPSSRHWATSADCSMRRAWAESWGHREAASVWTRVNGSSQGGVRRNSLLVLDVPWPCCRAVHACGDT